MTHWQSGDIVVNGLMLHYTRTGGAKPPVVLAHGFSDDGLCWTPVAEALATDYDIVMVDARGHGRSAAPEQGYGSADHADDLAGVIRALGLKRPAVLGHSMGAASTLVLAGLYPDLPRAILLEDPPPWWITAEAGVPLARLIPYPPRDHRTETQNTRGADRSRTQRIAHLAGGRAGSLGRRQAAVQLQHPHRG